jgi:hypothetical protein
MPGGTSLSFPPQQHGVFGYMKDAIGTLGKHDHHVPSLRRCALVTADRVHPAGLPDRLARCRLARASAVTAMGHLRWPLKLG